jgi:putative transposase
LLIPDRDGQVQRLLRRVFATNGIRSAKTAMRAPQAVAIAERFVRTVRAECLD